MALRDRPAWEDRRTDRRSIQRGRVAGGCEEGPGPVELSQRAADAFNERDLDAFLDLMDKDVEGHPLAMDMEGGYCGHSGTKRWWEAQFDSFPDLTIEVLDMVEAEDLTIAKLCMRGHGAGGSVPVRTVIWRASRWRDGKCVWWGTFRGEDDARLATGVAR